MAEPIGFYTAKRRPSGPPPRQFSYQDHFHSQPNVNYDPHGWHDPQQRAWTPEAIPNGNTGRVPLSRNRLKSQDPPHQEPIWPGTAPADDPFDYRFTPVVVEAPVTLTQAPVESAYPKPQQNRNSEPDMPRNYYPDDRYINPPNKRYANPPDDRYINPQNNRYSSPPDDRYINPPNNRYASPPDDRYINPPDPRVRRAQTPDNLDNDNRMRRARTPDNLDNDSGYYAPQPQKQYRRPKTPDDLDGPAHPRDRYDRARTPDALGDRVYPPRHVNPDRARRAATPDNLDGRPPRAPPMDQQRRAHTIDNSRPPRHPDNRYKRASTPDMLDDKPRYHTLDARPPLVRQAASTPEPRYPDNRQPLATRPDPYQRANTPDDLNGYPKSPRPDYTNRKQSLQPPTPRMQRAPSVEPYYELDPYGHALSTDNLDDVWGQMMQGNQDYENFDFDLVMTACKHNDESTTVRVDRVTRDQVDITKAHHIGDGPFKDIIINQATRKLPEVDEPEIKMKYLVHMKDKRKEIRELRYWFKPYINDDTQTDNAKEYFKTLLQPEQFPRDYVGYIKKALVLVRNFPMVSRLEIAMYPPPNDFEKRASFIDVQEEQIVVDRMQPLMDPATYGQGGPGGLGGWGGSTGSGLAFRDSHGPDLFAKVKQGDGREYYKDTADDTDDDIDYDQIIENFITVLTPNVYDYQYLPEVPVSDKSHIVFQVKAKADAHIALSSVYGDTDRKTYEVVIGGWNNNKSCIRYGGQGDIVEEATTFSILSGEELRRFWISWDRGLIQVGEGRRRGADTFLRYKIPENKQFSVNCLAVSTGQDSKGEWEFVELIRPKTADGLNFNYKTEKSASHTIVSRVRRSRDGPRWGPRPWPGDKKYQTKPKKGRTQPFPNEEIKAYPTLERSGSARPRSRNYPENDPPSRPLSVAAYPTVERGRAPRRSSQGDILDQPARPPSRSDTLDYDPIFERPSSTDPRRRPPSEDIRGFPKLERSQSRERPGSFAGPSDYDNYYKAPPGYQDLDRRAAPVARPDPRDAPHRQVPGAVKVLPTAGPRGTSSPQGRPPVPTGSYRGDPAGRRPVDEPTYATVRKPQDRPPAAPYGSHPEDRMSPEKGRPPRPAAGGRPPKPRPAPLEIPQNNSPLVRTQTLPNYGKAPNQPVNFDDVRLRPKANSPGKDRKNRPRSEIIMTLTKNPNPTSPKYVPSTPPGLLVDDEDNEEMRLADPRYTPRSPRDSWAYRSLPVSGRRNPRSSWSPSQGAGYNQPVRRSYSPDPSVQSSQSSAFRSVGTPRHLGTVR